jgi:predicted Rossmann fold nucleotide-binding protein DprA/Smf involved in DNA uptake
MELPPPNSPAYLVARVAQLERTVGAMRYRLDFVAGLVAKLTADEDGSARSALDRHGRHAAAVADILGQRPLSGRQVADAAGCAVSTAQATLRRLETAGVARETPAGWVVVAAADRHPSGELGVR